MNFYGKDTYWDNSTIALSIKAQFNDKFMLIYSLCFEFWYILKSNLRKNV